jgi:hypothetical protein
MTNPLIWQKKKTLKNKKKRPKDLFLSWECKDLKRSENWSAKYNYLNKKKMLHTNIYYFAYLLKRELFYF